VKTLLDTNVLLWWLADSSRLADRRRAVLADQASRPVISSVSLADAE
jgi:PIN domain nuclease of toxin-antitoxin system